MAIAIPEIEAQTDTGEQQLLLRGIGYTTYERINDALGENPGVRLIYVDGRLTFLTASRCHEWYAERLAELVKLVAFACGINWEDSGSATYRRQEKEVGVEGDKVFYLGANADRMLGSLNIDLPAQPPPDLAIEVEVTHNANDAMLVYGQLGVPEVWRFHVNSWTFAFCVRREEGTYTSLPQSRAFPVLNAADILGQMRLADEVGAARWLQQLNEWVRTMLLPRIDAD